VYRYLERKGSCVIVAANGSGLQNIVKKSFGSCSLTLTSFGCFFKDFKLFLSLPNPARESFAILTPLTLSAS
jgi:hypothetical protein